MSIINHWSFDVLSECGDEQQLFTNGSSVTPGKRCNKRKTCQDRRGQNKLSLVKNFLKFLKNSDHSEQTSYHHQQ